jgi:hypothetical protein
MRLFVLVLDPSSLEAKAVPPSCSLLRLDGPMPIPAPAGQEEARQMHFIANFSAFPRKSFGSWRHAKANRRGSLWNALTSAVL